MINLYFVEITGADSSLSLVQIMNFSCHKLTPIFVKGNHSHLIFERETPKPSQREAWMRSLYKEGMPLLKYAFIQALTLLNLTFFLSTLIYALKAVLSNLRWIFQTIYSLFNLLLVLGNLPCGHYINKFAYFLVPRDRENHIHIIISS